MKTKIEIELLPFKTPNFVLLKDGVLGEEEDLSSIPLSMVDGEALWRLCEDFKAEVFKKAKKEMPPQQR